MADAREGGRIARALVALGILLAFLCTLVSPVNAAGTTGTISGTVTAQSGSTIVPVAGVTVTAVSSNDKYTATTDAKGFFAMTGVNPDTYSISYKLAGYSTYTTNGITVAQDQVVTASTTLSKALVTIGTTKARSTTSAFQPTQTVDQYNFNDTQIATTLGKTGATNEVNLLAAIPGASFDNTGYPVLRGGRENEEGYQFEGIDYTDAFTSQFVNALVINGAANFQVTPGTGNASVGNAGTGSINVIAKRGKNPAFGQFEADVFSGFYTHELHGEYGFASPTGRLSNYSAFYGTRGAGHYGAGGADPLPLGAYFGGRNYQWLNEFTNNAVYKFGRDNNQSMQFFLDNTGFVIHLGLGTEGLPYKINDPFFLAHRAAAARPHQSTDPVGDAVHARPDLAHAADRLARHRARLGAERDVQAAVHQQPELIDVPEREVLPRERGIGLRRAVQRDARALRRPRRLAGRPPLRVHARSHQATQLAEPARYRRQVRIPAPHVLGSVGVERALHVRRRGPLVRGRGLPAQRRELSAGLGRLRLPAGQQPDGDGVRARRDAPAVRERRDGDESPRLRLLHQRHVLADRGAEDRSRLAARRLELPSADVRHQLVPAHVRRLHRRRARSGEGPVQLRCGDAHAARARAAHRGRVPDRQERRPARGVRPLGDVPGARLRRRGRAAFPVQRVQQRAVARSAHRRAGDVLRHDVRPGVHELRRPVVLGERGGVERHPDQPAQADDVPELGGVVHAPVPERVRDEGYAVLPQGVRRDRAHRAAA